MIQSIANKQIDVQGTTLKYYQSNNQHNQTIVLLHGYCGSSAYFYKVVPLLEESAQVIVFDLFGHGCSDALQEEQYDLDKVAALLEEAIQQLTAAPVYMFGHSLGGYITLAYAEQFSSKLKGFGLLHSTAYPDSEQAKENRINVINTVKVEGVAGFTAQLATKLFGDDAQEGDIAHAKAIGLDVSEAGVVGFAYAMRVRQDAQHIIAQSTIPVLLVGGQQDKIVTPDAVFAGSNHMASCHIISRAGHMGMFETAAEMAQIIKDFVSKKGN